MSEKTSKQTSKPLGHIMVLNTIVKTDADLWNTNGKTEDLDTAELEVKTEGGDKGGEGDGNKGAGGDQTPQLTADQKVVADKFGGASFNEAGDLLDKEGKTVKTKAELEAAAKTGGEETTEEEKEEKKFDANGNVVDETGKIIQTKEEYENEQATQANEQYFDDFVKNTGIQIIDPETKQPKVYEKSEAGLFQYVADVVKFSEHSGVQKLFKQLPDVGEYARFRASGGLPQDWFKADNAIDYSKLDVTTMAEDQKVQVLVDFHKSNGMDEAAARKQAKRSVDAKELDEDVKIAVGLMDKRVKEARKAEQDKLDLANAEEQRKMEAHWKGIEDQIVKKGTIGDLVIPVADREGFFKYLAIDVTGQGHSQAAVDATKRDPMLSMLIDYYYGYKKMDMKSVLALMNGKAKVDVMRTMKTTKTGEQGDNKTPVTKDTNTLLDGAAIWAQTEEKK